MSNKNPDCTILMQDFPLRIRVGFPVLNKSLIEAQENHNNGFLVTEVGDPLSMKLKAYPEPFMSYPLRAPRQNAVPDFMFGKMNLGDAFSAMLPILVKVPAIGSSITLNPIISPGQKHMWNMFNYVSYDVIWILHVPCPLGAAPYINVYAPELDETTLTRGIYWKPAAVNTVSVFCPYSNDLSVVPIGVGRYGQPGGSIVIHTQDNNTLETVNTPLNLVAYCCVVNVRLLGYKLSDTDGISSKELNFLPQKSEGMKSYSYLNLIAEEHADTTPASIEVSAEGGLDVTDQNIVSSAVPIAPTVEKPITEVPSFLNGITHSALDTGQLGTKWYDFKSVELRGNPTLNWTSITINPYFDVNLRRPGESLSLPWKRNVWCTGSNINGYITQLVAQINIPRPAQISGIIEVIDSLRASSRYLISFGTRVELAAALLELMGDYKATTKPRYYTNPWLKTDESTNTIRFRIISINRTADIADVNFSIMLRPAYARFNVPRKPISSGSTNVDDFLFTIHSVMHDTHTFSHWLSQTEAMLRTASTTTTTTIKPLEEKEKKAPKTYLGHTVTNGNYYDETLRQWLPVPEDQWEEQADFNVSGLPDPSNFVTPYVGECPEKYSVQDNIGIEEEINLDAFPILIYDGAIELVNGESKELLSIVLDLPIIKDQLDPNATENPITQRFERNANIIALGDGSFGAVLGGYTINFRLPTTAAGIVIHIATPGDMNDETAVRIFSLSSITSLAGTAFSAIGGPTINGIVNTAAPLISGVANAVGGKAGGTLADLAMSGVKGIANAVFPTSTQAAIQGAATNSIAGDIPISRFPQFVKYVSKNFDENPIFPTLLIQIKQFYENGILKTGSLPLSIFATMRNLFKVERNIFNRSVYNMVGDESSLNVSLDRLPYIYECFLRHPLTFKKGTRQSLNFIKFIKLTNEQLKTNLKSKGYINIYKVLKINDDIVKNEDPHRYFRESYLYRYAILNAKSAN